MHAGEQKILDVAEKLHSTVYEREFRGKKRGRFSITRDQLKSALGVERLHYSTIRKLQDSAMALGLCIIDLDAVFPCVEVSVIRKYRQIPKTMFNEIFDVINDSESEDNDEDLDE